MGFGLLSFSFALNVKDGNAVFIVRSWLFIVFLVVAQVCAVLAGLLIAREITENG